MNCEKLRNPFVLFTLWIIKKSICSLTYLNELIRLSLIYSCEQKNQKKTNIFFPFFGDDKKYWMNALNFNKSWSPNLIHLKKGELLGYYVCFLALEK